MPLLRPLLLLRLDGFAALSVVPSEVGHFWSFSKDLSGDVLGSHAFVLFAVAALVVDDHPGAEREGEDNASGAESCGCAEGGDVICKMAFDVSGACF